MTSQILDALGGSGSLTAGIEGVEEKKDTGSVLSLKEQVKKFLEKGGNQTSFREVLERLYGEKLIKKAFPVGWPKALASDQCFEILERIGQNVTAEDLEELYAAAKRGECQIEILNELVIPFTWKFSWWPEHLSAAPSDFIEGFIGLFLDPVAALELGKKPNTLAYKEKKAIPYIRYQKQLMRLVNLADRFLPEFIFAPRELEAKNVAYANPNAVIDGAVIPIFSQEHGRVVYYTLKGQIHKSGLHAYLFTSLEGGDFPAKLIFRGTNGPASIGRDLDTQGIGKRVFEGNREKIIALAKEGKTDRIEVMGHSLGAADAQRVTMLLADPESGCDFKEISLFAFCSPKLELEAIQKWENVLEQLSQKERPPAIHLNFAYHENDAATWMGDKYLTGASHEFVTRRYFVVKSKSGSSETKAHHTNPFFKYGNFNDTIDERTFVFLRSFPKEIYLRKLREAEAFENRNFLSRFVITYFEGKRETQEEIEKEWAEREKDKEEIAKLEKKVTQTSAAVRAGMTVASVTAHPALYQAYRLGQKLTAWWGG